MRESIVRKLRPYTDIEVKMLFHSGEEALRRVTAGSIDVLITPVSLEKMDGACMTAYMRRSISEMKVIVLTNDPFGETVFYCICAGAISYIDTKWKYDNVFAQAIIDVAGSKKYFINSHIATRALQFKQLFNDHELGFLRNVAATKNYIHTEGCDNVKTVYQKLWDHFSIEKWTKERKNLK